LEQALAQEINYEPQITPVDYFSAEPESPTTSYRYGPVDFVKTGFYSPTYKSIPCGSFDAEICYLLCYAGICYKLSGEDARVEEYIRIVDEREKLIDALGSADRDLIQLYVEVIGNCVKTSGSSALAYGAFVTIYSPEPLTKTLAAILTAAGASIICGVKVLGSINDEIARGLLKDRILSKSSDAVFIFMDLEKALNEVSR
jgi:hypothetical protein